MKNLKGCLAWILLLPLYLTLWAFATFVKKLPEPVTRKLLRWHIEYTSSRKCDFRIPPDIETPAYMLRWWRIARNAFLNVYYHIVVRSDDDRALHDHPWWSFSIVLEGGYYEHTIEAGGINKRVWFGPGSVRFRHSGTFAHRLELKRQPLSEVKIESFFGLTAEDVVELGAHRDIELPVRTIFITGPVLRRWGFHDAEHGWIDAYSWDAHCEANGIKSMKMDGGSDGVVSTRNKL